VPEVDFMVLCDYVRTDNGVFHMIAAGIDRIQTPVLPAIRNVGVAIRLRLTRVECDRDHEVQLVFQGEDGQRFVEIRGVVHVVYPDTLPAGWPAFGAIPFNLGLPLQAYGLYSLELLVDGQSKKSIGVIIEPAPDRG
jgi:hypothetical protein